MWFSYNLWHISQSSGTNPWGFTAIFLKILKIRWNSFFFVLLQNKGSDWFKNPCLLSSNAPIYLHCDVRNFWHSPVWNIQFDELDFFLVWKQTGYFYQFKLDFFSSFWARVKYFDGPCFTIYSLFTIYRDIQYQLLVWWINYTHCCESKKWKPWKFHICSLWNDIFNSPNWYFGFC